MPLRLSQGGANAAQVNLAFLVMSIAIFEPDGDDEMDRALFKHCHGPLLILKL